MVTRTYTHTHTHTHTHTQTHTHKHTHTHLHSHTQVIATRDSMHGKMESVVQQLLARNAMLFIVCNEGDKQMQSYAARGCKIIPVCGCICVYACCVPCACYVCVCASGYLCVKHVVVHYCVTHTHTHSHTQVPETVEALQPVINIVPLQMLSYHLAILKGLDVDQPRNLAKSVTVSEEQ